MKYFLIVSFLIELNRFVCFNIEFILQTLFVCFVFGLAMVSTTEEGIFGDLPDSDVVNPQEPNESLKLLLLKKLKLKLLLRG